MHYFFYVFFSLVVLFSLAAVLLRNPVHSVLSLIGAFLNTALVFILFSAEFMAMVLAIVYVGAIAVLFLFVVIMLNINDVYKKVKKSFGWVYGTVAGAIFVFVMMVFTIYIQKHVIFPVKNSPLGISSVAQALYLDYLIVFELSGVVLLVAMVGAISLTINKRTNVKRQSIYLQVCSSSDVKLVKVEPYKGVNLDD